MQTNKLFEENLELLTNEIAWIKSLMEERVEEVTGINIQKAEILNQINLIDQLDDPGLKELRTGYEYLNEKLEELSINSLAGRFKVPLIPFNSQAPYAKLVAKYQLTESERIVFILGLMPEIHPGLLNIFRNTEQKYDVVCEVFGGKDRAKNYESFLPTVQTALFILGGKNFQTCLQFYYLFDEGHKLQRNRLISLKADENSQHILNKEITIPEEHKHWILSCTPYQPQFNPDFPAQLLSTGYNWDDLLVDGRTRQKINHTLTWMRQIKTLQTNEEYSKDIKGFKVLFAGEPGTGKTLTAKLLGKELDLPTYRIDLSKIVSKYVGETEKNLEKIFSIAEHQDWILFFDEGDALFGKRSGGSSSNDRYANQEVSYLLQRIEDHPGIIILATNLMANVDSAFLRRFQVQIKFSLPGQYLQEELWHKAFSGEYVLSDEIDIRKIPDTYKSISPAFITNVKLHCIVMALEHNTKIISGEIFLTAFEREWEKYAEALKDKNFIKSK